MNIDKNLVHRLSDQQVSDSAKFLWLLIDVEEKDLDGFFRFSREEWSKKLNLSISQLKRDLKELYDKSLIEKDYRPNDTGGRKLFVKTCNPETLDNMTFFAEFEEIEEANRCLGTTKRARFCNVYNIAQTINLNRTWLDLKPEDFNSRALTPIEEGEQVCFQTKVTKTEKGYYLSNIHNIRRSYEYYDNR